MYWEMVLKEVLNKRSSKLPFTLTNIADFRNKKKLRKIITSGFAKRSRNERAKYYKKFYLGGKYKDVYFTKREAQCMVLLLQGKTINRTAGEIQLSPRTIEFYLKNMKNKVGCRTKFDLVEIVRKTDFSKINM